MAELTIEQWRSCYGSPAAMPYVNRVYKDEMALADVPENIRDEVETVVEHRVSCFGTYAEQIRRREATATDYLAALAELGVEV